MTADRMAPFQARRFSKLRVEARAEKSFFLRLLQVTHEAVFVFQLVKLEGGGAWEVKGSGVDE